MIFKTSTKCPGCGANYVIEIDDEGETVYCGGSVRGGGDGICSTAMLGNILRYPNANTRTELAREVEDDDLQRPTTVAMALAAARAQDRAFEQIQKPAGSRSRRVVRRLVGARKPR